VQICGGIVQSYRMAAFEQHRAGVETLIELHDGYAGFGIAREDGALDRRRAAPAREQRAMDVHAAETRNRQNPAWQDETVGHHYQDIPNPGRHVGVLLDASAQHAGRTGREVLTIGARTMGLPDSRVDEMLHLVSLDERE